MPRSKKKEKAAATGPPRRRPVSHKASRVRYERPLDVAALGLEERKFDYRAWKKTATERFHTWVVCRGKEVHEGYHNMHGGSKFDDAFLSIEALREVSLPDDTYSGWGIMREYDITQGPDPTCKREILYWVNGDSGEEEDLRAAPRPLVLETAAPCPW